MAFDKFHTLLTMEEKDGVNKNHSKPWRVQPKPHLVDHISVNMMLTQTRTWGNEATITNIDHHRISWGGMRQKLIEDIVC